MEAYAERIQQFSLEELLAEHFFHMSVSRQFPTGSWTSGQAALCAYMDWKEIERRAGNVSIDPGGEEFEIWMCSKRENTVCPPEGCTLAAGCALA